MRARHPHFKIMATKTIYIYRIRRVWKDGSQTQQGPFYSDFKQALKLKRQERLRHQVLGYTAQDLEIKLESFTLELNLNLEENHL